MKSTFEQNESAVIEKTVLDEIKTVEQTIRELSDRRQVLKSVLDKVKSNRPADYTPKQAPVKRMFSEKYAENASIASKINYILAKENRPMTSAEITDKYITLEPKSGGKKHDKTLKNIATILSIGYGKKYNRTKPKAGKFIYQLKEEVTA